MNEPMLEYVLRRLDETRGRWPAIADRTGVPYRTLQKIGSRLSGDPGVSHVQRLHDFFRAIEAGVEELPPITRRALGAA